MNITIKPQRLSVSIGASPVSVSTGTPVARDYVDRDPYTGDYTITPGDEVQILATNNLRMTGNITVEAIPSNYGKIGWNGSVLTVS